MYAAAEMSMNSVERVSECTSPVYLYQGGELMIDLDLDVEEEEQQRGIEPPAHWPSRDSVVQVENLTCHYAPQVNPLTQRSSLENCLCPARAGPARGFVRDWSKGEDWDLWTYRIWKVK
jgi:hypothetical protein